MKIRELTGKEKRAIRRLVKAMCANYDAEYGCLPLDGDCYMFGIAFNTSGLCRYFKNAVLPLNLKLERIFIGGVAPDTKPCVICGKTFPLNGRQSYCSAKCAVVGRRKCVARNVDAYRRRKRLNVIN